MKKIFLVDGDNNINLGLRGIEMLSEENQVLIFHSKAMEITKFKKKLAGCRAQIEFVESVRSGKNSLDFQITTELGFLSNNKELESAYIISCDKGYDAAVDYVKNRYSAKFKELDRRESIFDCFQMAFVLKAKTKNELSSALVKEYGPEHGLMVFNHLKSLFGDVVEEAPEEVKIDAKLMEKAEKTVSDVQNKVKKTVKKVKTKTKPEPKSEEIIFSADEILVEEKSNQERRKTRPQRKPKAAKASRHGGEKREAVEEKLDAAAETVVETVEVVKQKVEEKVENMKDYDLPLRFGSVRTEEQNQSFYKSKDLRKKTKPQKEEDHVEAVVEMIQEKNSQSSGERKSSGKGRDGQRRSRKSEEEHRSTQGKPTPEGKVVPMKPRKEAPEPVKPAEAAKPAEATAVKKEAPAAKTEALVKKASGQNNAGFFGRMFNKKKK